MAVVILNAPPASGKDTIANLLVKTTGYAKREFKQGIYDVAKVVLGKNYSFFRMQLATRGEKEKPQEYLGGLSPRQFLIKVSEEWIKPVFGEAYFGEALAENLPEFRHTVVSDRGFLQEAIALAGSTDQAVVVVRLFREGYDFSGDSRDYLPTNSEHQNFWVTDVHLKEDDPQDAVNKILAFVGYFLALTGNK